MLGTGAGAATEWALAGPCEPPPTLSTGFVTGSTLEVAGYGENTWNLTELYYIY